MIIVKGYVIIMKGNCSIIVKLDLLMIDILGENKIRPKYAFKKCIYAVYLHFIELL